MASSNTSIPEPPTQLKAIQSFMKIAADIERLDPVVSYWVRLYSTETALKIDRESPDCKTFLGAIILWLENFKQTHKDNEAVGNQTVGQAHMENFVVALFNKVDTLDREGTANKNTVRMFFMAAVLFEAMAVFGPLTDEISKRAKYAKFKAAYIQKCLKLGQTPKPGPLEGPDLDNNPGSNDENSNVTTNNTDTSLEVNNSSAMKPDPFILTPSCQPPSLPVVPPSPKASSSMPTSSNSFSGYPESKPTSQPSTKPEPSSQPALNTSTTTTSDSSTSSSRFHAMNGAPLGAEDILKGQKFCKFANSALQYDDIPTAVENLEKALRLLKAGQRSD